MGHMPVDGEDGTLQRLRGSHARRILIHINNTNPILIDGSPSAPRSKPPAGRWPRTAWRSCCEIAVTRRTRSGAARHRRQALSPAASVPRLAAWRPMHEGPGAGLGAQPLLLSGDDPDQGRQPDRALRGFGLRREWRSRLVDHDGEREGDGGIARWLKLTDGLGLDRDYVTSLRASCPARVSRSTPMCISCARRRCWKRSPRR